jgi:cytochrome c oxidase cbb3-type subunit III
VSGGRRVVRSLVPIPIVAAMSAVLGGCERQPRPDPDEPFVAGRAIHLSTEAPLHPGPMPAMRLVPLRNPFEGDRAALVDGERLYGWYNCGGCHGAEGGGGIGPPLRDDDWIYGADPASVYQSIAQGQPNGMPAYGGMVVEEEIWKLVAYVHSLGERAGTAAEGAEVPVTGSTGGDVP